MQKRLYSMIGEQLYLKTPMKSWQDFKHYLEHYFIIDVDFIKVR